MNNKGGIMGKRGWTSIVAALCLIVGYVACTWQIGIKVERNIDELIQRTSFIEFGGYHTYDRGLFSSTLTLNMPFSNTDKKNEATAKAIAKISHGPLLFFPFDIGMAKLDVSSAIQGLPAVEVRLIDQLSNSSKNTGTIWFNNKFRMESRQKPVKLATPEGAIVSWSEETFGWWEIAPDGKISGEMVTPSLKIVIDGEEFIFSGIKSVTNGKFDHQGSTSEITLNLTSEGIIDNIQFSDQEQDMSSIKGLSFGFEIINEQGLSSLIARVGLKENLTREDRPIAGSGELRIDNLNITELLKSKVNPKLLAMTVEANLLMPRKIAEEVIAEGLKALYVIATQDDGEAVYSEEHINAQVRDLAPRQLEHMASQGIVSVTRRECGLALHFNTTEGLTLNGRNTSPEAFATILGKFNRNSSAVDPSGREKVSITKASEYIKAFIIDLNKDYYQGNDEYSKSMFYAYADINGDEILDIVYTDSSRTGSCGYSYGAILRQDKGAYRLLDTYINCGPPSFMLDKLKVDGYRAVLYNHGEKMGYNKNDWFFGRNY